MIFLFLKFVCQQTFSISYNYVFAYFLVQDEVDELEWIVSYIFQSSVEKNFLLRLKYLIKSRKLSFDVSLSCIIPFTGAKNKSFWDIKLVVLRTKVHSIKVEQRYIYLTFKRKYLCMEVKNELENNMAYIMNLILV